MVGIHLPAGTADIYRPNDTINIPCLHIFRYRLAAANQTPNIQYIKKLVYGSNVGCGLYRVDPDGTGNRRKQATGNNSERDSYGARS